VVRIQDIPPLTDDRTVYVVGTGPSLRCLDLWFLKDKVTIGLNQAWKHLATTYSITVHPELVLEYQKKHGPDAKAWATKWVVKKKPPLGELPLDDPSCYVFHTDYKISTVVAQPADTLYLGEGVQTTAIDLAVRMGARFVVLVGCDGGSLGNDFHAHDQHVRWLGMQPHEQYALYRQTTAAVRAAVRSFGTAVMSLTPFIGATAAEEDYARLRKELKLEPLPAPVDTSPYKRDPKTIRTGK
jgi:hypothetical protein